MAYVEFLRARKRFLIYAAITGGLTLLILVSLPFAHVGGKEFTVGISSQSTAGAMRGLGALHAIGTSRHFPLGVLLAIAGYCCTIVATSLSISLNKQNGNLHYTFTKPISRQTLALQTMGIDAVAIACMFLLTVFLCLLPFAEVGLLQNFYVDSDAFRIAIMGIGVAYMWYALVQAVTAGFRFGGGTVVGISWAVFWTMNGLASVKNFGPIFATVIQTLNVINPIGYFFALIPGTHIVSNSAVFGTSLGLRIAAVWAIAALAAAVAVVRWKRIEV